MEHPGGNVVGSGTAFDETTLFLFKLLVDRLLNSESLHVSQRSSDSLLTQVFQHHLTVITTVGEGGD